MGEIVDIFLFENHNIEPDTLKTFFDEMNSIQNSFIFRLHKNSFLSLEKNSKNSIQNWNYLIETIRIVNNTSKYKIAILSEPIENNWFSVTSHQDNIAFITTHDWGYLSELSVYSFLLFEIVMNFQEMKIGMMNAHDETIGCINDMCGYKLDIGFKIKTGWVCHDCLSVWSDFFTNLEIEDIQKMLDYIRLVALNRKHTWKLTNYYPFPVSIRFKIMQSEQNAYMKFQKMLDLYDSIVRYIAFILLSAVPDNSNNIPKELKANKKKILNGDPSLGTWEYIIKPFAENAVSDVSFLSVSDLTHLKEIYQLITCENIRRDRNDYRGHNYTGQNLHEYLRLYLSKISIIQQLLSLCEKSIFKYILSKFERIHFEKGQRRLTYRRLMGDSIIFDCNTSHINNVPHDETYLLLLNEENGDYISVFPYIQHAVCLECNHERILYWDGVHNDGCPRFIDTLIGHRTRSCFLHEHF